MPRTPYCEGVRGLSSILILTTFTLGPSSLAISSSAGPIILNGPHHSAQKSTTTGPSAFRTSVSKEESETACVAMVTSLGEIGIGVDGKVGTGPLWVKAGPLTWLA